MKVLCIKQHGWAVTVVVTLMACGLVAGDLNAGCDIVLPEMECKMPNGGEMIDASRENNMDRFNDIVAFGMEFVQGGVIEAIETKIPGVGFLLDSWVGLVSLFSPNTDPIDELRQELLRTMENLNYESEFSDDVRTLKDDVVAVVEDVKDYQNQDSDEGKLNELRNAREHCEDFHTKLHQDTYKPEARLAVLYEYCGICSMVFAESIAAEPNDNLIKQERTELLQNCANFGPSLVEDAKENQEAFLPNKVEVTENNKVCYLISYTGKWNYRAKHGSRTIVAYDNRGRCVQYFIWPGVPLACQDAAPRQRHDFFEETEKCYNTYNNHFKHNNNQFYQQRVLTPSVYYKAALNENLATDTIRIQLGGDDRILSLCEVKVYGVDGLRIPLYQPTESSNYYEASDPNDAFKALDGSSARDPPHQHISCTHTQKERNPYWQAKFASGGQAIGRIVIVNRETPHQNRLAGAKILINNKRVGEIGDGTANQYTIYPQYKIRAKSSNKEIMVSGSGAGSSVTLSSFWRKWESLFQFIPSRGAIGIKSKSTNNYLKINDENGGVSTQTHIGSYERFSLQFSGTDANTYFIKNNKWQKYLIGLFPFARGIDRPSVFGEFVLELRVCGTACVSSSNTVDRRHLTIDDEAKENNADSDDDVVPSSS